MVPQAPYYVYDEREIRRACRRLQGALEGFGLLYSVKANPFPPVLRVMASQGFGADAASLQEVDKALSAGFAPEDIYFSAPGKTPADLSAAAGKCVLIADSLLELQRLQSIAASRGKKLSVGLRIHPDFTMDGTKPCASRFGIDVEQLEELKRVLAGCPDLVPVGIHVHLKSQVLDGNMIAGYYRNVMALAQRLQEELQMELQFVNFGSGIGIPYDPAGRAPVDLEPVRAAAKEIVDAAPKLADRNAAPKVRLLVETGRYVLCQAGRYILPVIDKKVSHGTTFLIVPCGMNGFLRPVLAHLLEQVAGGAELPGMEPLYTCRDQVQVRVLNESREMEEVTVVGNLCSAMDVLAGPVCLNKAEVGDLIELSNAGSYAYTLSPLEFASQAPPAQYLLQADGTWVDK